MADDLTALAAETPTPRRPRGNPHLKPFTPETAREAARRRHEKAREAKEAAERAVIDRAAEMFKDELLGAVGTWKEVMVDRSQPGSTRIQAADRFVDRALGPVGQKLEITDASSPWAELTPEAKRVILAQLNAKLELEP